MPSYNKVMLMGHLTRDVELRHISGDTTVANFGLATNRKFKKGDGSQHEEVLFTDCEAWGRNADTLAQYLSKGDPVFIEGRLKLDQWEDQQGNNRSKIKVVVESFQFVGGGGGGESKPKPQTNTRKPRPVTPVGNDDPGDIPF